MSSTKIMYDRYLLSTRIISKVTSLVIVDTFDSTEIIIPTNIDTNDYFEYCRELNELDRDRALYLKQINEYTNK